MGFGHAQSERAVRLYGTVHAALDALLSGKGKDFSFLTSTRVDVRVSCELACVAHCALYIYLEQELQSFCSVVTWLL
jgi:hypothetical protein